MHLSRPGPWAGLGGGICFTNTPCSSPRADSGFAAIPPTRPTVVSKKKRFQAQSTPGHHARPSRRRTSAALTMPVPTVVECMRMVVLIVFDCGCEAFQSFLSRSHSDFN